MRGITLRLYVRIQQVLARLGLKLPGKIMYIGGATRRLRPWPGMRRPS